MMAKSSSDCRCPRNGKLGYRERFLHIHVQYEYDNWIVRRRQAFIPYADPVKIMKTTIVFCGVAIMLSITLPHVGAGTIVGPITNPDNGHDYYLLAPNTWTASETEAETLGGTLAVVKSAAENEWIFPTFGSYGGATPPNLWIGLRRESQGGPFVWVTGASLVYTNWAPGEPDNVGNEMYVHMYSSATSWEGKSCAGKWNDAENRLNLKGSAPYGVVEVPRGKSLTERQKSLIGTWYESGRSDRQCFFAASESILFAIDNYGRSARVICDSPAVILATGWHSRGEILQDKILWSNSSWWSRKASDFTSDERPRSSEIQLR